MFQMFLTTPRSFSYTMKVMADCGMVLIRLGTIPLYIPRRPSLYTMFWNALSVVFGVKIWLASFPDEAAPKPKPPPPLQ